MITPKKTEITPEQSSLLGKMIRFCLQNKLIVFLFTLVLIISGILVAPFDWNFLKEVRRPIPVDAIPDIGENQQIVFTEWVGRSPQDVEDQLSYPLTVQLLGISGVKTIRSYSMFGFSSIYIIFKDNVYFYWSRTRVLEKINSLSPGSLPIGVQPKLGPDATALGQVFWYTLEGIDPSGEIAGGWDQEELRTIQDWYVRYWLLATDGVSEVASIGGFVREYQIDIDPYAMQTYGVTVNEIYLAVKNANIDVGAKSIEVNKTEYFIRSIGFIKSIEDIENSVIKVNDNDVPVLIKHIGKVHLGPATRRGTLDKGGAPAVGGVVVARYGENPLKVISNVKKKIIETQKSLPEKAVIDSKIISNSKVESFAESKGFKAFIDGKLNQDAWLNYLRKTTQDDWPEWVTISKVKVVPFYDRTGLIYETLGTLNDAIILEILITIIVVLVMVMNLRSGLLISSMLPIAVLLSFVAMKLFKVQANMLALAGIAIAIGTIVDMGIVICENIMQHLNEAEPGESRLEIIHRATSEVGGAVLTSALTTVVSFLPIFFMIGAEGKMFKPLAFTKSFAIISSIIIALLILPPAAYIFYSKISSKKLKKLLYALLIIVGTIFIFQKVTILGGILLIIAGIYLFVENYIPKKIIVWGPKIAVIAVIGFVVLLLARYWEPLGADKGVILNLLFVILLIGGLLLFFKAFEHFYSKILTWCLGHKLLFLSLPAFIFIFGMTIWLGFDKTFAWLPNVIKRTAPIQKIAHIVPGLGREFMPNIDEGSFLFMPTTMTHASIGEAIDILQKQDIAIQTIPEVESVVGKLGRADTPLDPAPISMFETVINYKPEFISDTNGRRIKFKFKNDEYIRDSKGELIKDPSGRPFRQWREHIKTPDDIWNEIIKVTKMPGTTSAPKLQPIGARIVMLQSGMRAPMGVKVKGPSLESIEKVGLQIEQYLKEVPSVEPSTVIADRIVGKPYLEIVPDRKALARFAIPISKFQNAIEVAIGGKRINYVVMGRERFPIRVRYDRELRDNIEALDNVLIPGANGKHIPITELAEIRYVRGPQVIKSEDTFLVGYVVFDKQPDISEVDVVEQCQAFIESKIASGEFALPAGVSYTFAGSYENQLRAAKTLSVVLPGALFMIFMLIYFKFRSVSATLLVFMSVFVAWSGGFIFIWLYGQTWFLNFNILGASMRTLFRVGTINLSVAVWVGFLALFGIATDAGVVISTYLQQRFRKKSPKTKKEIRLQVVEASKRRVRACLMTTATTILALIPVITSNGRGSDIMLPMAVPIFGGMMIQIVTMLIIPVIYCLIQELKLKSENLKKS
jgi:Cu(I)/Ag(I) efflux system membrane protein CusA/SilA